ncbi:MAG: glycosyltransferase family 4 protein [Myxococcales bacterium]|nr:glycosyltransferase family 4 protein [Myxococcales bacterium]
MRILVDVTTWVPGRTGIGLYTERLLRALVGLDRGDELLLASNLATDDVDVPGRRLGPQMPLRALWMQTAMGLHVARERPDVAFFPNYVAPLASTYASACPTVVTVHDMAVFLHPETFTFKKRVLQRRLLPPLLRHAKAIVTPSEATRTDLLRLLPVDPRRVVAIPLAADPAYMTPVSAESQATVQRKFELPDRYLLAVSTLEPRKNLVRLIEAFEQVWPDHQEVKLILVGGKGWRDDAIAAALRQSSARDGIEAFGYVEFDELRALYAGALAMCYPSLYEGFGLPVIEAMACGAPVLVSRGSSLDEVAGDAALQVDPLDTQTIVSGIRRLLDEPELRSQLARRGLAQAQTFSWARTAEQTREVFERVAGGAMPQEI